MKRVIAGAVLAVALAACAGTQASLRASGPAHVLPSGWTYVSDCAFRDPDTIVWYKLVTGCRTMQAALERSTQTTWARYNIDEPVASSTYIVCSLSKFASSVTIARTTGTPVSGSTAARLCAGYEAQGWQR